MFKCIPKDFKIYRIYLLIKILNITIYFYDRYTEDKKIKTDYCPYKASIRVFSIVGNKNRFFKETLRNF